MARPVPSRVEIRRGGPADLVPTALSRDLLVSAEWLVPVTSDPVREGGVLISSGRIAAFGKLEAVRRAPGAASAAALDLGDAAILPGLVNAHTHLELTLLRGLVEEQDFFRWIRRLTRLKYEVLSDEELDISARLGAVELARAGVTSVGDVTDHGAAVAAVTDTGLRGVVFQEVFGPEPAAARERCEDLAARLERHRDRAGERVRLGVSPHAPYTVSPELFRAVSDFAVARSCPLAVHAAESASEDDFLRRGEGPFARLLGERGIVFEPPRCSAVEYLEGLGVLEARPLLVHCVRSTAEDIERIRRAGAAVAHCPRSSAKLGHGTAPLREMLDRGVTVGIGTDSVASANRMDLFEETRAAILLERVRSQAQPVDGPGEDDARQALRLMTIDAARCLGLGKESGSIEEGKFGDLAAVSLAGPHMLPTHDVETTVAWSASASDVLLTIVGGEVVFHDGRVRTVDEDSLREVVKEVTRRLGSASV